MNLKNQSKCKSDVLNVFLEEAAERQLQLVDDLRLDEPHDGVVHRVDEVVGQGAHEASAHLN